MNIPDYPSLETVLGELQGLAHSHLVAATEIARQLRSVRASNMVLLGAASVFLPLETAQLAAAIRALFARKGDRVVAKNLEAFQAGRQAIESARAG